MSELKAGVIKTSYGEGFCFVVNDVYHDCDEYETKFYLKSEADKVIAELKEKNERLKKKMDDYHLMSDIRRAKIKELERALWIARAERYKMSEFIAREEANLCNQISWSRFLRERTYNQWVDQLLRIANLANKLHKKCRAKAEEYK